MIAAMASVGRSGFFSSISASASDIATRPFILDNNSTTVSQLRIDGAVTGEVWAPGCAKKKMKKWKMLALQFSKERRMVANTVSIVSSGDSTYDEAGTRWSWYTERE